MTVALLGDSTVVITLGEGADVGTTLRAQALAAAIARRPPAGLIEAVPAYGRVALFFDGVKAGGLDAVRAALPVSAGAASAEAAPAVSRLLEVPVCYGGEYGPDLEEVAAQGARSAAEVIARHAGADYFVHAIGFVPGFPYLGGLPAELATPRRATPRPRVPAGAVGIGGTQTGIYPFETPGGWNLIGRTPLALFDAAREQPSFLRAGDRVKFRAITPADFQTECNVLRYTPREGDSEKRNAIRDTLPAIEVVRAGMFTTVQDLGRTGHRASGVPLSGAVDAFALRLANLLVGNPEHAAGLEFTLVGPELRFRHAAVVAIGGAVAGELPRWRPFRVAAGDVLRCGPLREGCRGYLAVAGGIEVAPVLGSRSTYTRAGLGGWQGRALREGDVLPVPSVRREYRDHWRIDERILPRYSPSPEVRVLPGADAGEFDPDWFRQAFRVSSQSDRMGLRLAGEPLGRAGRGERVSSPVAPGTVQVPPDGQPIVLLADAQTIGGYSQLAHVLTVDLPLVAQLRPGEQVRFRLVTPEEAQDCSAVRERALALLREGLAQKLA